MKLKLLLLSLSVSTAQLYAQQSEYSTINKPLKPISKFSVNYECSTFFDNDPYLSTVLIGIEFECFKSTNEIVTINARGGIGKYDFDFIFSSYKSRVSYYAVNMLIGRSSSFEINAGIFMEQFELTWPLATLGYRNTFDDSGYIRTGIGTTGLYAGAGISF